MPQVALTAFAGYYRERIKGTTHISFQECGEWIGRIIKDVVTCKMFQENHILNETESEAHNIISNFPFKKTL
jgi:hypothetical protein